MKISSININPIEKMYNTPVKQSKISFAGGEDTFVKTGVQTFADAKKAIQMKYQPAISKLRAERENVCNNARNIVLEKLGGTSLESDLARTTVLNISNDYKEFKEGVSYRAKEANLTHRLDGWYIGNGTGGYYKAPNCIMCVSKDKELGEKTFRNYEYYLRGHRMFPSERFSNKDLFSINKKFLRYNNHDTITEFEKIVQERVAPFRIDFKSINDVVPANASKESKDNLYNKILDTLEEAEKKYQKTGRSTVLHVKSMETLIDGTINTQSEIASLKDIMSDTYKNFHTTMTFVNTNPVKSDPATIMPHRVTYQFNLDEMGRKKDCLFLNGGGKNFQSVVDTAAEEYKNATIKYEEYTKQIEALQKQCKEEVSKLDKSSFPKKGTAITTDSTAETLGENIGEQAQNTVKKLSKNKKIAIALAALAVLGTTFAVLYKKGVFKKLPFLKNNKSKETKTINKPAAPALSTSVYMPIKNTSTVFDAFLK